MKTKHTCEGHVFSDHWSRPCGKSAAHEHDGHWYCKTHHPPTVAAKSAARREWWQAKLDAEREAARAKKLAADEQKRRADCYDELLSALQDLHANMLAQDIIEIERERPIEGEYRACMDAAAAAIAKAIGDTP